MFVLTPLCSSFVNYVFLEFEFILFWLCSLMCNYGVKLAVLFLCPVTTKDTCIFILSLFLNCSRLFHVSWSFKWKNMFRNQSLAVFTNYMQTDFRIADVYTLPICSVLTAVEKRTLELRSGILRRNWRLKVPLPWGHRTESSVRRTTVETIETVWCLGQYCGKTMRFCDIGLHLTQWQFEINITVLTILLRRARTSHTSEMYHDWIECNTRLYNLW